MDPWIWLGLFILLAYGVEAITGFGSIVIALSLGALMLPLAQLLPVLVPLNCLMTGYLVTRHHRHIHWPTLLKLILPLMVLGTLAGYLLRPHLAESLLQLLLGVLIVAFAGRELWRMARQQSSPRPPLAVTRGIMFAAGISHGLFASGGPLLVYGLTGVTLDKARFRATLVTLWLSLNGLLTLLYLADGSLIPSLPRLAAYLPVLVLGVVLGEWLHHRVNEQRFRQLVFVLLVVTGIALVAGHWI
ncbi:MAG: sulfite exporter TauE/SafE family protein [Oleiphilaceae bacterium]|nr:sulfite exporter TauE/SafE family protein [Oleiphilaceae bacterium]